MAPFRLEISDHAAQRLRQRGIAREQVRQCLALGTLSGLDVGGRLIKEFVVRRRRLAVVYIEVKGGVLVVTAYWKD